MNEIKTQFTTREGLYKLLSHSEYSRPNRVPFNSQGSNPVRVSFVNVNDQSGNGDRLCFNVGRELYFYIYKGVRKVPGLGRWAGGGEWRGLGAGRRWGAGAPRWGTAPWARGRGRPAGPALLRPLTPRGGPRAGSFSLVARLWLGLQPLSRLTGLWGSGEGRGSVGLGWRAV